LGHVAAVALASSPIIIRGHRDRGAELGRGGGPAGNGPARGGKLLAVACASSTWSKSAIATIATVARPRGGKLLAVACASPASTSGKDLELGEPVGAAAGDRKSASTSLASCLRRRRRQGRARMHRRWRPGGGGERGPELGDRSVWGFIAEILRSQR